MNIQTSHDVTITNCDKEPIHIPSSIQPHGLLLTAHPETFAILQFSENLPLLFPCLLDAGQNYTISSLFGALGKKIVNYLRQRSLHSTPNYLDVVNLGNGCQDFYNVIAHIYDGVIFIEFEKAFTDERLMFQSLYPEVHAFTSQLQNAATLDTVYRLTAKEVLRITGYGRVLIYRFDEDWHGMVVAEALADERFPSLEQHYFPSFDIPKQARELYRLNRLRIIPDAHYKVAKLIPALNPVTQRPLDMSNSVLRSVSPIHIEYMKNMETMASMSISVVVDDKLWGLIACHNRDPKHVPFEMRSACDFISHFLSLQISAKEYAVDYKHHVSIAALNKELLAAMSEEADFTVALKRHAGATMALTNASGAAILTGDKCVLIGESPTESQVRDLASWLGGDNAEEVFHTASLASLYPQALAFKDKACGLLAITVSKLNSGFIFWFRPERMQTISWSGRPEKNVSADELIQPRKSFKTWKEIIKLKSLPWRTSEVDAAKEFRNSVVGIVLRQAEEMAKLSEELSRTNHELEAFSHSVSHDLRAPFRHIVGYSELIKEMEGEHLSEKGLRYLNNVIESGQFAGQLVDNLLRFSQIGRLPIEPVTVDMNLLLKETRADVMTEAEGREIHWRLSDLPVVRGDILLLRVVLRNLLANAVKYTRGRPRAEITVGFTESEKDITFHVFDNGTGFDMQYVDKLFGVFQRLHKMEDFEGTGIGLANVKRIITRQGGKVWAEGEPGVGARFYFSLPKA